jgi:purine-cytosine permease-like protein
METHVTTGAQIDVIGRVETRGIDFIPEEERHSSPRELAWAMFAAQFGLGNMVLGSLPILFGLGWWAAVAALTIGLLVGTIAFVPMALIGPKTGTNGTVSSGAFFGVRGRFLGTGLVLMDAVVFYALVVWATGGAAIGGLHRFFGTGTGTAELSIAMALAFVLIAAIAILGHATLVASLRIVTWTSAAIAVLAAVVVSPDFEAVSGGSYLLGSFWPTWAVIVATMISLPVSWSPFANDYGRYIPRDTPKRAIAWHAGLGMFAGCWVALMIGAFVSTTFAGEDTTFVQGFIDAVPLWFVAPLVLTLGISANVAAGAMSVYCAGLDLHGIFWRTTRAQMTVLVSLVGPTLAYVTLVVLDVVSSIQALVSVMLVTMTPWVAVNIIGHVRCRGHYSVRDLHAFSIPNMTGRYWFRHGVDPRAAVAWTTGVAVGLLFTNTKYFVGPLVDNVGNIDLSFVCAGLVTASVYLALLLAFPHERQAQAGGDALPVPSVPA